MADLDCSYQILYKEIWLKISSSLELLLKVLCFTIHLFWELSFIHNVVKLLSALHAVGGTGAAGTVLWVPSGAGSSSITEAGCRARKCLRAFIQGLMRWLCLKRDSSAVHRQAGLEETGLYLTGPVLELWAVRLWTWMRVEQWNGEERREQGTDGTLTDGHGQGNWRVIVCEYRS